MEKNEKLVPNGTKEDGKVAAKNEPNYRGIKAMPFVLGKNKEIFRFLLLILILMLLHFHFL